MRNHSFTNVNSEFLSSKISMLFLCESSSENDTLNSISNGCLSAPHRQSLESHFKYLGKKAYAVIYFKNFALSELSHLCL